MVFHSRSQSRFAILTPASLSVPMVFRNVDANKGRHDELLSGMQRLRGRAYEMDGAVNRSELTADWRHKLSIDEHSWHVLSLDANGAVIACLRYLEETHASGFEALRVRQAALSWCPVQGSRFLPGGRKGGSGGPQQLHRLRRSGRLGGARRLPLGLKLNLCGIVLATYALLQLLGGSMPASQLRPSGTLPPLSCSASVLLALQSDGEEIAPYHDPQYGCLMQILRFDSRFPNPRYRASVAGFVKDLATAPVVCSERRPGVLERVWRGMEAPEFVPALQECNG